MTNSTSTLCPCGSSQIYADCCALYHTGQQKPATPEILMRSRYTAYAMGTLSDYLVQTTHRKNHQYTSNVHKWRRDIDNYCKETTFKKLTIVENKQLSDDKATVTFKVHFSYQGNELELLETSLFLKAGQRWLYLSGETDVQPIESK